MPFVKCRLLSISLNVSFSIANLHTLKKKLETLEGSTRRLIDSPFNRINFTSVAPDKAWNIEFSLAALVVHVADLAKDLALLPPHVVHSANGPHATDVSVGISTVQAVLVVQVNGDSERFFRALCPFEDLLRPVHPQEPMHFAIFHQLELRGVPQVVVCFAFFELSTRESRATFVFPIKKSI